MRADLDLELLQRLRKLPDVAVPPYGYGEFSRRRVRRRSRQAQAPLRLIAVALAVVVAGWVMKQGFAPPPPPRHWQAAAPMQPAALVAANTERWLNEQPRSAIVRVPTQMAVAELEDQIAAMDDQLNALRLAASAAQQVAVLQRDRAQLLESLAQVRYAQILVAGAQ